MQRIIKLYRTVADFSALYLFSALVLFMRLWMAKIFWWSGLTKISSWSTTIALFTNLYKIPVIPPMCAACLSTATELTCPILLTLGLASRFATIPMLIMTAVIQCTYAPCIDNAYWAMLLATILLYGPGIYSLDAWIKKEIQHKYGV